MNKLYSIFILVLLLSCKPQEENIILGDSPESDEIELLAPGIISTELYERDFAISPNRSHVIYSYSDNRQSRRVLVQADINKLDQKSILPFSGKYDDIEPFFSPAGDRLFFASNRPIYGDSTRTDFNIWFVDSILTGWGSPTPLDSTINTVGPEYYPAVTSSGNLYFTATRADGVGREDLFVSKYDNGQYSTPTALDSSINSPLFEFNAYVSPNEDLLIFSSFGRADGKGGGDLYYSTLSVDGKWNPSQSLSELNSEYLDYCPYYDISEQVLYFTSERKADVPKAYKTIQEVTDFGNSIDNGFGNIFRIKWTPGHTN